MKRRFFILLTTLPALLSFASTGDSLVRYTDLVFKNDIEREIFKKYTSIIDSSGIVDLFMMPYETDRTVNTVQAHKMLQECMAGLQKEVVSKSDPKKVKAIYDYIHKKFLKVYEYNNSFADIFEKGEYNCVSASALYAILFSRLGIPYQIKETPQHVYLVAFPQTHKIMIETTRPDKGYYQFTDDFVRKYVNSLIDSKQISQKQSDTTSVNELFNSYFFSDESISLIQLAGIQYSNYAVYYLGEKKYEAALCEIQKAQYLQPCERNKFLLKSTLLYQLANNNYSDTGQVNNLAMVCRFNNLEDKDVSDEGIRGEFIRLMEAQLISRSDFSGFDVSYKKISSVIKDTALHNEISFIYHSELARLGYINMKDKEYEMYHLKEAYRINPKNANLQGIILSYFQDRVLKGSDARSVLNSMDEFSKGFDFLNSNIPFNKIKAACLLELAYESFSMNQLVKGDEYLKQFEKLSSDEKSLQINPDFVEKAYSVAAGAYYKKGNYAKAKQYIKTGLLYAPYSFGLKQRLSQF